MLVFRGVFNTIILDATNYVNQDYMRVNYTFILVYTMLLVTGSHSKNTSHVFAWIWPNSERWLVNHFAMPSIAQTWVLASIGAVVEKGVLSTLKRLLMESNSRAAVRDQRHRLNKHRCHLCHLCLSLCKQNFECSSILTATWQIKHQIWHK
jgi:hypothetical protein